MAKRLTGKIEFCTSEPSVAAAWGKRAMTLTDAESREIDRVADLLGDCRSLLFITGAGISADSGLPTYRGIGGLYDVDRPRTAVPSRRSSRAR